MTRAAASRLPWPTALDFALTCPYGKRKRLTGKQGERVAFIKTYSRPTKKDPDAKVHYVYFRPFRGAPQKAKVFRDHAEAEAFFLEVDAPPLDPAAVPFERFWRRYLDERATRKLTDKVFPQYERIGARVVVPYFQGRALRDIKRSDIPAWIAWAEKEAGAGTVEKAYTVLSSCLTYAVDLDLIPNNPARGWGDHLPKVESRRERPHLTTEQVMELADKVNIAFSAMIVAMGILGLRPSEVIALLVKDVDLTKGVLHVRRSAVDVRGRMKARNTTKGGTEEKPRMRTIPLMGLGPDFGAHLIEKYSIWEEWELDAPNPEPNWEELVREHGDDILFTSPFSRSGGYSNARDQTETGPAAHGSPGRRSLHRPKLDGGRASTARH
jgi:hypothetical protein